MSKYPNCRCRATRFSYFRRKYKNGTLHLLRKCEACGKIAPNAMTQADYDTQWVETLQIVDNAGRSDPVQNMKPVQNVNPVQSRADQIHAKLQRHIANRTA